MGRTAAGGGRRERKGAAVPGAIQNVQCEIGGPSSRSLGERLTNATQGWARVEIRADAHLATTGAPGRRRRRGKQPWNGCLDGRRRPGLEAGAAGTAAPQHLCTAALLLLCSAARRVQLRDPTPAPKAARAVWNSCSSTKHHGPLALALALAAPPPLAAAPSITIYPSGRRQRTPAIAARRALSMRPPPHASALATRHCSTHRL
jgi:hypothetical protein